VLSYEEYINEVQNYLDDNMKKDYDKTISMISEIALPSIITLLQQGIKKRTVHKKTTILNSGFSDEDKANRFLTLEYQYRMHPEISCIPRRHVYNDSALKDDIRSFPDFKYYLPNERRLVVTDVNGAIISRNQNEKEALKVIEYIKKISDYASKENIEYKIAVLAFYNGQVILLRKFLQDLFKTKNIYNFNDGNVKVSLNTVDKFQGQEADIVVLTMVRNDSLGFMDSINRVNVAITRAKEKLIVIGDKKFFGSIQKGSTLLKSIFNGDDN
jgi:superfamily I DNA and/or RNA helicase